jgi:gliding motility-associated-like protein
MKNIIYIVSFFACFNGGLNAQILITGPDYPLSSPCTCASAPFIGGATPNFFDSGNTGNYSPNENETITFCPDANGSKVSLAIGINAGYVWDVHSSDMLYVYDGPNTSSPLLWSGNSTTNPTGVSSAVTTASWNNTSGCITVQFISDGAIEGQGWAAFVSCGTPWQPFDMHMTASINGQANGANDGLNDLNPLDTGYVDVCLGDSILFTATPIFPYEPGGTMGAINGGGYNQSTNYAAQWTLSNGTTTTANSFWFKPAARVGYFVELKVTDPNGQFQIMYSKVRVSTIPSFTTCVAIPDTICLGQASQLVGGITPADTAGVAGTSTSFQILGSFGQQLYLPDGSGQNYTTNINIAGFPAGSTLQNAGDLEKICVDIEHSYLGDLEMMLTCPNGQSVNIFNAYTGNGLFPGGFGGGGTFLGGANDNGANGVIGVCETYCFSNDPGSLPSWNNGYNTVPTSFPAGAFAGAQMVQPGTYNPEQAFVPALAGCPLNGQWTLTIRDNLSIDDGFVCSWGIYFNGNLNPGNETYQPYFVSENWTADPTIVAGIDTIILVVPTAVGNKPYTFNVTDNFGCKYDTTIIVTVRPGPSITTTGTACDNNPFTFTGTLAPQGGNWAYVSGPGSLNFAPNTTFVNPAVTATVPGEYTVSFIDNMCQDTLYATLNYAASPTVSITSEPVICEGDMAMFYTSPAPEGTTYEWSHGSAYISNADTIFIDITGLYTLVATNFCGTAQDTASLLVEVCEIPNVISPNNDGINDVFYTRYADNYTDVNLTIYNRWGRIVFKTDSYHNNWSGQNMSGGKVADGVYYYVMIWDGGSKNEAGTVTVFDNR